MIGVLFGTPEYVAETIEETLAIRDLLQKLTGAKLAFAAVDLIGVREFFHTNTELAAIQSERDRLHPNQALLSVGATENFETNEGHAFYVRYCEDYVELGRKEMDDDGEEYDDSLFIFNIVKE